MVSQTFSSHLDVVAAMAVLESSRSLLVPSGLVVVNGNARRKYGYAQDDDDGECIFCDGHLAPRLEGFDALV